MSSSCSSMSGEGRGGDDHFLQSSWECVELWFVLSVEHIPHLSLSLFGVTRVDDHFRQSSGGGVVFGGAVGVVVPHRRI